METIAAPSAEKEAPYPGRSARTKCELTRKKLISRVRPGVRPSGRHHLLPGDDACAEQALLEPRLELSTRPEKRVGTEAMWDRAEALLAKALDDKGVKEGRIGISGGSPVVGRG